MPAEAHDTEPVKASPVLSEAIPGTSSAGNCAAGGSYTDSSGNSQAFVASETSGTWGKAKEVPGTAALNTGGGAAVESVSCASAGNCAAGGFYTDSSGHDQAFVVNEVSGIWRPAEEVPGTATITNSVSCASPGNCSAGGVYIDSSRNGQAFVVNEVSGIWRTAKEVPGTATLNTGGDAAVESVSCAAAGSCSAAGGYFDSSRHLQVFVVNKS